MKPHCYQEFMDTSFDGQLQVLSLQYLPWVGRHYRAHAHPILIVAESAYDWTSGDESAQKSLASLSFLRECVREQGLFHSLKPAYPTAVTQKMYRGTERLFWNQRDISDVQRDKLWMGVAVHQFVQRPMASLQTRPGGDDYANGARILRGVMEILQPQLCIFLGTDGHKFNAMAAAFGQIERRDSGLPPIGRSHPKVFDLQGLVPPCRVCMVRHPSKFFSWSRWAELLRAHSQGVVEDFQAGR